MLVNTTNSSLSYVVVAMKGWFLGYTGGPWEAPGSCGKAGERAGSTCAIDVEGLKRRPSSKVGGLCHQFRV